MLVLAVASEITSSKQSISRNAFQCEYGLGTNPETNGTVLFVEAGCSPPNDCIKDSGPTGYQHVQ